VAKKENNNAAAESRNDFRISNGAVVNPGEGKGLSDFGDAIDLPRVYGEKIFFAVARDPHTIVAYWNVDWPAIFFARLAGGSTSSPSRLQSRRR